ncbi:MAG: 30S ribosomal protein S17e [Desulfurococcaceae archaeon]
MGKVRTKLVKRIARELFEKHPGVFTRDFNVNKQLVSKLATIPSKKLRNQVAGYITHLVSISAKRRESAEAISESSA